MGKGKRTSERAKNREPWEHESMCYLKFTLDISISFETRES